MFLSSLDLWLSRINRLKRHPSREIVTFCLKKIKKIPKNILTSKDKAIDFNHIIIGYINEDKILNDIKNLSRTNFYFNPFDLHLAEIYKKRSPKSYNKTLKTADEYINGNFEFLGKKVQFENWHSIEGIKWSSKIHPKKINYFGSDRKGDIKYIWELNRMQFLPLIGKAYFLTKRKIRKNDIIIYQLMDRSKSVF